MQKSKKPRGLFERPPGSGVWWINYYVDGRQRREKIGSKSAATAAYRNRKDADREGRKLPTLRKPKVVTLSELIDDAVEFVADHRDRRNYVSRAEIVRKSLGSRPAADITPQELDRWLRGHYKNGATSNRYKSFFSLCYREGIVNGKVNGNPARLVRHRLESVGRIRYLSREEYERLHAIIHRRFPNHLAEFVFSIHSGARLSEQYTLTWKTVSLDRRTLRTARTKSNRRVIEGRTLHLNAESIAAIESMRRPGQKSSDTVFPRQGQNDRFDTRSWFGPCMIEAEIEDYVWHSNRHTFCSWLAIAGASLKDIQELAGHKTIAMSARYSHLSPEHRSSAIDRISAPLNL